MLHKSLGQTQITQLAREIGFRALLLFPDHLPIVSIIFQPESMQRVCRPRKRALGVEFGIGTGTVVTSQGIPVTVIIFYNKVGWMVRRKQFQIFRK